MPSIEQAREALLRKRTALLRRRDRLLIEEHELAEQRETDFPDVAADRTAASLMERLDESELLQLHRIGLALQRIELGDYGRCTVCGGEIPAARLGAMPEADRCAGCTNSH